MRFHLFCKNSTVIIIILNYSYEFSQTLVYISITTVVYMFVASYLDSNIHYYS